jgi:hypothetical protein
MTHISLYAATVPGFQQVLGSVLGLLEKAEEYCREEALEPSALIEASIAPDMLPFSFQIKLTAAHSLGAIEGVQCGLFAPDSDDPLPQSFGELRQMVQDALNGLSELEPAQVDAVAGRDMRFEFGDRRMDFTAEDYLLSFAVPNFYFHAATAYDILRMNGVPIGKRDYLGKIRLKVPS